MRDFDVRRKLDALPQYLQQSGNLLRREQARCAAAEKHALDPAPLDERQLALEIPMSASI